MPRQKKYTSQQIVTLLKEIDHARALGNTVKEAVENSGISLQTYSLWREKYGWMTEAEVTQLQELKAENAKLKRLLEMWVSQMEA